MDRLLFSGHQPPFNSNKAIHDVSHFKRFPYNDKEWKFGGRAQPATALRGPILVLWLHVKTGDTKTTYVAKTVSGC